ncbi:MAG TPA: hypothetical protein VH186_11850 [Chloroflexia bacterium]|nr:hypothetical protein [Chloroflexia bacterium]
MAEIEISILQRQALQRRIGSEEELVEKVYAVEQERNSCQAQINWQFDCETARTKLRHLYPRLAAL